MQKNGHAKQFFPGLFANRQKGQLFSLDFIISMVAVTAAIGLLIHGIEVNAYSQKEQQLYDELKQVAETAADLLVTSDGTTCEIQSLGGPAKVYLVNCLDEGKIGSLGDLFPNGYCYESSSTNGSSSLEDNCGVAHNVQDFYEAKREIVTLNLPLNKKDFEECLRGAATCKLDEDTITIKVWRI